MEKLKEIWLLVKKNWIKILLGVVACLAAIVSLRGAKRTPERISRAKDRLEAKGLEAELDHVSHIVDKAKAKAAKADKALDKARKVQIYKKWEADKIAEELRRRGY